MSYRATAWAYDMAITGPQKPVLVALADMADEAASCYPGQSRIAEMTGLSVATVRRALDRLEAQGLIVRHRRTDAFGHRTSDRYTLQLAVSVPESLPLTLPSRQRAYKAESQSLPLRESMPTAHSARGTTREPSENHQGAPLSEFCGKHPTGTDQSCVGCMNARRRFDAAAKADRVKPTVPGIVTEPDCELHPFYPARDCPRCTEEAVAS